MTRAGLVKTEAGRNRKCDRDQEGGCDQKGRSGGGPDYPVVGGTTHNQEGGQKGKELGRLTEKTKETGKGNPNTGEL